MELNDTNCKIDYDTDLRKTPILLVWNNSRNVKGFDCWNVSSTFPSTFVFDCNNIHRCSLRSGTISSVTRQSIRYTQSETSVLKKRRRVRFENGTNERKEICVSDFCKIRPRYERSVRCAFALCLNRFPCFPACSENRRSFMRIIPGRTMHRRCTEDTEIRNTCTFCVSNLSPF